MLDLADLSDLATLFSYGKTQMTMHHFVIVVNCEH